MKLFEKNKVKIKNQKSLFIILETKTRMLSISLIKFLVTENIIPIAAN